MTENRFPRGWNAEKASKVADQYSSQTEDEAVAEDEAAFVHPSGTWIDVPNPLVSEVRELIARFERG